MNKQQQPRQGTGDIWSQYLQRRVMRLLLLHAQQLFRGQFAHFFTGSSLPTLPVLQFYDRYLKLLMLSEELLNDILPRIRLQLSLQIDQLPLQEEAPTRGEIDWPRTIARAINETPDLPPQLFETRQRQQHINVPENLLFVAILLQHQQIVRETLKKDQSDELLTDAERQQLVGIDEALERELATPDARLLREAASRSEIERLVKQVAARLRPGAGPYRDLLAWWEHFNALHIGQSDDQRRLTLASTRKNEQDAWLYELWIALELLTLLQEKHALSPGELEIQRDRMRWVFTWENHRYRFQYQRRLAPSPGELPGWEHAPALQPSYLIERATPLVKIEHEDTLIWQDPPFLIAAAYATDGSATARLGIAIQELSGGLHMYNAYTGALCFPLLSDPPVEQPFSGEVRRAGKQHAGGMPEQSRIQLAKITPDLSEDILHQRLLALIQQAAASLPEREQPACHGIVLDADSVNASGDAIPAYNVLCPKPHIGPGVFDLVNDQVHCLKDPRVCHIWGQAKLAPFVVRATTQAEMDKQSSTIRGKAEEALTTAEQAGDEARAEELRNHVFQGVGRTVEQYVKLRGNTEAVETNFEDWVFEDYWKKHPRCLHEETRHMLLSGEYVWLEYLHANLKDWAAPAIQFCRALEKEVERRLHDHYPHDFRLPKSGMTLGALRTIYLGRDKYPDSIHNWKLFRQIVQASHSDERTFEAVFVRLVKENVAANRNLVAHNGPVSRAIAQELHDTIIGKGGNPGILRWMAENLEPKQ